MAPEVLKRDQNHVTVLGGVTNDADMDVTMLRVDPLTKRLLVAATGTSGSGVNVETPSGTVDGANTVFTVSNAPKFIVIDSSSYFETLHYTYLAGTITVNALIAPTQFIRSIY